MIKLRGPFRLEIYAYFMKYIINHVLRTNINNMQDGHKQVYPGYIRINDESVFARATKLSLSWYTPIQQHVYTCQQRRW